MFSADLADPRGAALESLLLARGPFGIPKELLAKKYDPSRKCMKNLTKHSFQVFFNVTQFDPEDLDIKTTPDGFVVIHGKHNEKADEHGFVSREFIRRIPIPPGIDSETITSNYNRNGILVIQAPLKVKEPDTGERRIKIEMQALFGVDNGEVQPPVSAMGGSLDVPVKTESVGTTTTNQ